MPLPHWIARLNKRLTNRFVEPLVRRSRHFGVVHHVGRSTGNPHRTPLLAFSREGRTFVALTYGPEADWVRNVMRGPARWERQDGQSSAIADPMVVPRHTAAPALPRHLLWALRLLRVTHFLQWSDPSPPGGASRRPR